MRIRAGNDVCVCKCLWNDPTTCPEIQSLNHQHIAEVPGGTIFMSERRSEIETNLSQLAHEKIDLD